MLFTFIIAQTFLAMLCGLKFGLFIFFSFWMLLMSIVIKFFLPETKGIPIEEMAGAWTTHWFWKRFVTKNDNTNIPNGARDGEAILYLLSHLRYKRVGLAYLY
ncbi:hypothetical protein Vadar_027932 [Vaccinium darrowii]|uniref:Uncharacterized protein n=1 Tax=Vaccinium darrowii TaxID=229202 RepID=A0ACB7YYZ6_9ERIC|nr:hypothetical protein Vadar_027932 [Vaccinium darrowii]